MDAIKGNINSILNGFKQFTIPVYQRTYSWEREQCQRLWDDIVEMQKKKRTGHFVGAIVNIAEQAMPTGVQKFMIIDGQQRMTTLTLLLLAVRNYGYDNPQDTSINPKGLNGMSIQNDYGIGEEKYKMLLTQTDKEVLIRLVEQSPMDGIKNSRLLDNYEFFVDMISRGELTPTEVIEGVAKLQIVNITLDRTVDDAQLIFESLNSTGMDLSQSDLIRNYILMGLEPDEQQQVYNNYWILMERKFDYKKQTYLMDRFFRDYLTCKTGKIPNVNKVYDEFKNYYHNSRKEPINALCNDLLQNATYYTNILNANTGDKELDSIFSNICDLRMEVSYPFLIKVYGDYSNELIDKSTFKTILVLCENYVFRRAICGIPTNSLNKTFRLAISSIYEDNYLDSIKAFFLLQDSYKVFPIDEEFFDAFKFKDIYNMRTRNYILSKFENHSNKAPINIENYTIEHIMPQNKNLSIEWQEALGADWQEDQKSFLNTIGNLTLTAYNSEMSDSPFDKKLNMKGGFKESALRINSFVVKQTTWNKELLLLRADELCTIAKEIWSYPELDEEILSFYIPQDKESKEFKLDDFEHLNGKMLDLFNLLDKRILNISSAVKRDIKKLYIAYKADTNFVDIVPQKSRLRLSINMRFPEINDPKGICVDVTNKGRWGNGDIEVRFNKGNQIEDVMKIIEQSYNKQME